GELTQENASSAFKATNFKDIRDIIINKKKDVIKHYVYDPKDEEIKQKAKDRITDPNTDKSWENAAIDKDFVVVIKADPDATYKNVVDMLDEMTINNVKRFAMVKITDTELGLIKVTESANK